MIWILLSLLVFGAWVFVCASNSRWKFLPFNGLAVAVFSVLTFLSSINILASGEAATELQFGVVTEQDYGEGVHFILPWRTLSSKYSTRRELSEFTQSNGNPMIGLSSDPTEVQADLVVPYKLSVGYLGKLYKGIGGPETFQRTVVNKAVQSATRDALPGYTWKEAAASKKLAFGIDIGERTKAKVTKALKNVGFTQDEVDATIQWEPVDMRQARPTNPVIVNAVADKLAEVEELEKEVTTTLKAEEIAKRRSKEGKGIANLFNTLPDGYTASEVSSVLHALADYNRADGMKKMISQGKGDISVMAIPSTSAVSIPAR